MYDVNTQGIYERLINVHYYYYYNYKMIHDKPTLRERKKLLAHFGTEKECRATPPGEVLTPDLYQIRIYYLFSAGQGRDP